MGIQDFSKVFEKYTTEFKEKSFENEKVAIDAFAELHRAIRGMKDSNCLRDSTGRQTSHINVLLGVILNIKKRGGHQYWVIDYLSDRKDGEPFHNSMKELEIKKRHMDRKSALKTVSELEAKLVKMSEEEKMFSDGEGSDNGSTEGKRTKLINEIDKHKKRAITLEKFYIDDMIFILDMLEIPWCMAPKGYDGEQICAAATYDERIIGIEMDYVLSPDADAVVCGAKKVIKRDVRKKKLFEYKLADILNGESITREDLAKISVILGCDYTKTIGPDGKINTGKSKGIGKARVMEKFRDVILTEVQENAIEKFLHVFTPEEIDEIDVHNAECEAFTNMDKYNQLVDWAVFVKGFNKARLLSRFKNAGVFDDE